MKLTLGEKLFVGIPACVVLVIVVDATAIWTFNDWVYVVSNFISGYIMWTIWENRHALRNPHEHTD